jgi:hypothetical protein
MYGSYLNIQIVLSDKYFNFELFHEKNYISLTAAAAATFNKAGNHSGLNQTGHLLAYFA